VQPLIPGGYILLSRKILNNEIMKKPPLYFKIWAWILLNAQHKDYGNLKRGQLFTSIPEMQEAMSYKVGYRIEKPTKKRIWGVLEWLRNPYEGNTKVTTNVPMIETTKVTHGIIITVVNYDLYQTPSNYEGNNEGNDEGMTKGQRRERQGNNINKNDKNDKNDKNEKNINNITLQILDLRSRYSEKQLQIIDEYFDILKWTRRTGKIADSVVLKIYQEWEKYPIEKVIYALHIYNNNPKHHDKKENYCYGIMRNTTMEEIEEYKRKQGGVNSEKHGGNISRGSNGYGHDKQSNRTGKFDNIEIPGIITG